MTTLEAAAATLSVAVSSLGQSDAAFAHSLLSAYTKKGGRVSDKQAHWIETLAKRAVTPPPAPTVLGDAAAFDGITALFAKAGQGLKRPAVTLVADGAPLRLSVAGPEARKPGTINAVQKVPGGESVWLGRILADGTFEASRKAPPSPGQLALLRDFAADPAGIAADCGKLTGRCSFCSLGLTDARSLAVGYGKICADNYSLPWGEK